MKFVGDQKSAMLQCLKEFSSSDEQRRLWLSDGSSGEVSSFSEAFEGLFTDIDVIAIARSGELGNPNAMVAKFEDLESLLSRIDYRLSDAEKIEPANMVPVRNKAQDIIESLPDSFKKFL